MNIKQTSSLRIIGGCFKGRKIIFAPSATLRPTTDRIRETVFNWLQPHITNATCLDLFAGSGALGLEACSRGAQYVTFIDQNTQSIKHIQNLIHTWGIHNATAIRQDARHYLQQLSPQNIKLIFLDPPFHTDLLSQCVQLITAHNWLAPNSLIYTEQAATTNWQPPQNWHLHKSKTTAQICYSLWIVQKPN